MRKRIVPVTVELETDVDHDVSDWAQTEGRSKRRHLSILARKLASLRKTNPDDLQRLGLMERPAAVAH